MTTVYLIRHGRTPNNLQSCFNGARSKVSLDEVGVAMADRLGKRLLDVPFDAIYSSDLIRAYETAEGVRQGRDLPIIKEPLLREIDFGDIDGMLWDDVNATQPHLTRMWKQDIKHFKAPGATEGTVQVATRMMTAFLRILRENRGKTVAIVGHGAALEIFSTRLCGRRLQDMLVLPKVRNASLNILKIEDDGHFTVEVWNDISHYLPEWVRPAKHASNKARRLRRWFVTRRHFHKAFKISKKDNI